MKALTFTFFALALTSLISSSADAACRFSKNAGERQEANAKGCAVKLCMHTVVCDDGPSLVVCPAKSGVCDGYDADECVAQSALIAEDAKFVATQFVPQSTAPSGDAGGGMGGR